MPFTYEIDNSTGSPVVKIANDGVVFIEQPHHHEAPNNEPFATEVDAIAWADNWLATEGPVWESSIVPPPPKPDELTETPTEEI
jgi:hypothetical protein